MKNRHKLLLVSFLILFLLSSGFSHGDEEHDISDIEDLNNVRVCLSLEDNRDSCYSKLCGEEKSKYVCAEKVLEAVVSISGPERAMGVLNDIMASSIFSIKTDGHQLAHTIGRSTAHSLGLVGEAFMRCPIDFNYGCQHGFFEKALANESQPEKAAATICESLPDRPQKNKFYCYHGVGHGFMFYESYNLLEALDLCDKLPNFNAREGCWQGVFMENVNGKMERIDGELGFKDDDPLAPCNSVDSKYRQQCYLNHAGYVVHYANFSLKKATSYCLGAKKENVNYCLHSIGLMTSNPGWQRTLGQGFKGTFIETAIHLCDQFPKDYTELCTNSAVSNIMNFDNLNIKKASSLCQVVDNPSRCFRTIGQDIRNLIVNEDQVLETCKVVPKKFRADCMLSDDISFEGEEEIPKEEIPKEEEEDTKNVSSEKSIKEEKKFSSKVLDFIKLPFILIKRFFILIQSVFEFSGNELNETEKKRFELPDKDLKTDEISEKLLYDDEFMEDAILNYSLRSLTKALSILGKTKGVDCHNRAHELGRRGYELLGNEAFKNCGVECHSGCRHGATEAFFADKGGSNLKESIELLCGDETTNFGMHQCLHGAGHGLMAWFDYGLHKALKSCDLIERQQHKESCYSGVFMENIVGGIVGEGGDSSKSHYTDFLNEDPHYPCNILDDKYKGQCYFLQTDRMLHLFGNTKDIGDECSKVSKKFQWYCFFSMGRTISGSVLQDPTKGFNMCREVTNISNRNICLTGVLTDLLWDETHSERALFFCSMEHDKEFIDTCYDHLVSISSEIIPDGKREGFCKQMPKKYYQSCIDIRPIAEPELQVREDEKPTIKKTKNAIITYENGKYTPETIHISVGQKVTFVNKDDAFWPASNLHPTHTAYPGSDIAKCFNSQRSKIFDACKSLGVGKEYSFVFDNIGEWRYHDHINPRATGTIIVSKK